MMMMMVICRGHSRWWSGQTINKGQIRESLSFYPLIMPWLQSLSASATGICLIVKGKIFRPKKLPESYNLGTISYESWILNSCRHGRMQGESVWFWSRLHQLAWRLPMYMSERLQGHPDGRRGLYRRGWVLGKRASNLWNQFDLR